MMRYIALEAIWKIASKSNNYTSLLIELRAMNGIQISSACLLASLAYILFEYIRERTLIGTELECARVDTIRLKLLKIGAVIIKNTRRICFMLSSHYPYQSLFNRYTKSLHLHS